MVWPTEGINQKAVGGGENGKLRANIHNDFDTKEGAVVNAADLGITHYLKNITPANDGIISPCKPQNSFYTSVVLRNNSFQKWPLMRYQDYMKFADSGFYCVGPGNSASCFQCGIGLSGLTPACDIWANHAEYSPKCMYLRLKQGQEYVAQVQQRTIGGYDPRPMIFQTKRVLNNKKYICRLCRDFFVLQVVRLPCGHMSCIECTIVNSVNTDNCPFCRTPSMAYVRAILPY